MLTLARHTNSTTVNSALKYMVCISLQVWFRTLACSARETIKMCVLWLMSSMPRLWDLIQSVPWDDATRMTISFLSFKSQGMENLFPHCGQFPGVDLSLATGQAPTGWGEQQGCWEDMMRKSSRPFHLIHSLASKLSFRECLKHKQKWLENDIRQVFGFWENK